MINFEKRIFLEEKIPIRLIQEPFCKKCMNSPVTKSKEYCDFCLDPRHVNEWHFNKVVAIGNYKTCDNIPYNNIPFNIISKMILILKGEVKKQKEEIGKLIADGLVQTIKKYSFLIKDKTYLLIPPKNNKNVENQCIYFLKPLIDKLNKEGFIIEDISIKIRRIREIGQNKEKTIEERFTDMENVHCCDKKDLHSNNILILDDIVTTKSTINDIARALKKRNAGEINVLCVGRALSTDIIPKIEGFPSDLDFTELLTYFSTLDIFIEPKKIEDVDIKVYNLDDKELKCKIEDYEIFIDFENMVLKHNCEDFIRRRYKNKSFCKHITKLFIKIKEDEGINKARKLLNSIYKNLLNWNFKIN